MKNGEIVDYTTTNSPLGKLLLGATAGGVCLVDFIDDNEPSVVIESLNRRWRVQFSDRKNKHLDRLTIQLSEYFAGQRSKFNLPIIFQGTPFQVSVWKALQQIPFGKTICYAEQAALVGRPRSFRAVAQANGANPIGIVVPCHRVIGKSGNLTGYGGGLWRKQFLLELEGVEV